MVVERHDRVDAALDAADSNAARRLGDVDDRNDAVAAAREEARVTRGEREHVRRRGGGRRRFSRRRVDDREAARGAPAAAARAAERENAAPLGEAEERVDDAGRRERDGLGSSLPPVEEPDAAAGVRAACGEPVRGLDV